MKVENIKKLIIFLNGGLFTCGSILLFVALKEELFKELMTGIIFLAISITVLICEVK